MVSISGSCESLRRGRARRDSRKLVRRHRLTQAGTCALRDLPVLLARPAQTPAARAALLVGELRGDHPPLIVGQLTQRAAQRTQLLARQHQRLDRGACVDQLDLLVGVTRQRGRVLHGGLDRAASAERPSAIAYTREKTQLESVGGVLAANERTTASHACDELERRLAVTVFEIVTSQPVTVNAQQQLAARLRDDRDVIRHIPRTCSWRRRGFAVGDSFLLPTAGRHMSMSLRTPPTPPSDFRGPVHGAAPIGLLGYA
jgi:hypothetical protein